MLHLEVAEGESVLASAAALAHRHLRLDAVYIAELTDDEQIYRATAGDAASFGVVVGGQLPRSATFCHRLVTGAIRPLIRDTLADPRVAKLPGALDAHVGAYVGVPLCYSDGSAFGTLCALGRQPDPTLDHREVGFLTMLAELLTGHLDEQRTTLATTKHMQQIIDGSQLDIAAQPIISLHGGTCIGIEALSRFRTDIGSPDAVFAAAERVGLGVELERLAVSRAWPLLDMLGPEQFLTVNLSPAATSTLSPRAHNSELALDQVVLEITEHAVISGYADLRELLRPLRERGLRVAVDDAGAGYASLRHVVELHPDFIKIDRDLVHGVAEDHARRVAVSAFVLLAIDLNATIIAEGLERPQDLATLIDLGVDAAQGYLLGRPTTDHSVTRAALAASSHTELTKTCAKPRQHRAVMCGGAPVKPFSR